LVALATTAAVAMMATRTSYITRIFDRLVREGRRSRMIQRHALTGGAELVVLVDFGRITLTIKRMDQPLGERELITFRRDCHVPDTAEVLSPPEQGTRVIPRQLTLPNGDSTIRHDTWRYVTWRWPDTKDNP
jgi:hypothetical protein